MPYEIDVLLEFYKRRLELGSHLSSLDRFTLDKNIGRTPLEQLIEGIRCETGILYDQGAHFTHTNVLLYGQPTKPEVS